MTTRAHNKLMTLKQRAARKHLQFNLTIDDVKALLEVSKCALCKCKMTDDEGPTQLTIDRINHLRGYVRDNVQAACYACNQRKSMYEDPRQQHKNHPITELQQLVRYRARLRERARKWRS